MSPRHAAPNVSGQYGWGRIVGLTSGGPMGFPSEVTYGAAKAAQVNYTLEYWQLFQATYDGLLGFTKAGGNAGLLRSRNCAQNSGAAEQGRKRR